MADREGFQFEFKYSVDVEKSTMDQACKTLDAFYNKYENKKIKIDTSDMVKAARHGIAKIQDLYKKGLNEEIPWWDIEDGLQDELNRIRNKMQSFFANTKLMFSDGFTVDALSDGLIDALDRNATLSVVDLTGRIEDLYHMMSNVIKEFTEFGGAAGKLGSLNLNDNDLLDQSELERKIELVRYLIQLQEEIEEISGSKFKYSTSPIGLASDSDIVDDMQDDLDEMRQYNIETVQLLNERKQIINDAQQWWDESSQDNAEDKFKSGNIGSFKQYVDNLKECIADQESAIAQMKEHKYDLFPVDFDDRLNEANEELQRLRDCLNELEGLQKKEDILPDVKDDYNFSDVIDALVEVKEAILEIKKAFDPLTQAFANEESAIHAMVTSNVSQLEELIQKFKEVHNMVDSLNSKDFNITNVITQKGNTNEAVRTVKTQAKTLLDVVKQLVDAQNNVYRANNATYQAANRQSSGLVMASLFDLQNLDVEDLTKKIAKSGSEAKLYEHISTLEYYKDTVLKIINELNKVSPGIIDTDAILSKLNSAQKTLDSSVSTTQVNASGNEIRDFADRVVAERKQIDSELGLIRQKIEETFNFGTINPDLSNVQSITSKIYEQFEELQNKIKQLDFTIEAPKMDGVVEAINVIKQEGEAAESAVPKKDAFTKANQKVAASMKETGSAGRVAADGVQVEENAVKEAAKALNNVTGLSASAEIIAAQYKSSGRVWDEYSRSDLESQSKLISDSFNKYISKAGINVSDIDTTFLDKAYKKDDGSTDLYEVVKLVAKGTDAAGKVVTIIQEYNMASAALEKESTKFHDAINKFDLATAKSTAQSQIQELKSQMGSFKIDISDLETAQGGINDEDSFDVFNEKLKNAKQRLAEIKTMLKSSKSLDPLVNSDNMMSNLETTVETYRENIKKFADVDGFDKLGGSLGTITSKLKAFNEAKGKKDGNAMAQAVAEINKEIANYNSQLNLVKARYQENNRVAKESEKVRKNALQEEKALLKEISAEDKLTLDKDKQFSLLSKQAAQWEKNGQLTDEARQKIDLMLDSLAKVTNSDELSTWKTKWSIVKNEIMETKYQIDAAKKAQDAIDKADAAVQRKENEDRAYWDKERKIALNNLITPEKRPELEQLKSYMLQQAAVTKESVEEQYNAIMTIATKKNEALQKLMSVSGANEKQHWQDEYSAWFGAWNKLDKDAVNNFFEDVGNQAILGVDKIDKFNDAIKESHRLEAKLKDQKNSREQKESDAAAKKALAEEKALLAEEKALMKEIVSEEKFALDKDKQFALLSKQQAQWNKTGQLTDEVRQTINDMLDSLSNVTNSDELAIWKKQWSIVKDEVLTTKYEIEAAAKAQKATANERKASGAYWDKEFKYSLNNMITPEKRPELEQLKVYMLQQAEATESAVNEQYDAIFTIIQNKNNALKQLMSAKGPNDKQYWQDQYSAWYGAWNKLDRDVVSSFFDDAGNQAILGADKIDKFNDELERSKILSNQLKDQEYNEGQKKQDKINKQNQNYGKLEFNQATKFLEKMNANVRNLGGTDQISQSLNALVSKYTEAYKRIATIRKQFEENPNAAKDDGLKAQFQDAVLHALNLKKEIQDVFKETQKLESISDALRLGEAVSLDELDPSNVTASMIAYAESVSDGTMKIKGFNEAGTEMYGVIDRGNGVVDNFTVALDNGTNKLHAFTTETKKASNEWEDFKAKTIDGAKNIVGMYVGVQEAVQAFRQGVEYVKEIDLAMTELKKVTDDTDASYKQFLKDAAGTSSIIGSTISDFTEATATFARLGYSLEESASMAETAIIYKNVADGLDTVEEASDSIVSTMMAFGIQAKDTMSIVDKFNAVGNNFAITSAGIGDALQRSASALFEAGNTIDESIALVTAANSVVQNPEQVGTALKTLSLRIRGVKTELEEAGLETEGMAETTAQLQAKLLALTGGKVDIMLNADEFKSTTQVLREMADAWEDMTDIERAAALELLGGKRQANILSSVIANFETVEDVIETSMNSAGSAMEENEKYLDSIQGRIDLFNNSMQKVWSNFLDSERVKDAIDQVTTVVNWLDTLHGKVIAIVAAIKILSKAKGINLSSVGESLVATIKNVTQAQQVLQNIKLASPQFDKSSIAQYAGAVATLTANQQANLLASQGLNKEQIVSVLRHNQVSDAVIQEAIAQGHASRAKTQAATSEQILNQIKNNTIAASMRSMAQTKAEADKVKLLAVANEIAERSSEELTEAKLKEIMVTQQLSNEIQEEAMKKASVAAAGISGVAKQAGTALATVGTGIKAIFASNPVGAILTIVSTLAMLIPIGKSIYEHFNKSAKEIKQEFDEATNTIKEVQKSFKDLKSSADDVVPRFAELAKGVDKFGNNVSLTDDEYKEFISLNNEIVELFPEISTGMDSNGNAMLSLSYTADTLTQSLWDMVEAQRAAANQAIADTMPDVLEGIKVDVDAYKDEKKLIDQRVAAYESAKETIEDYYSEATKQSYMDSYGDGWAEQLKKDLSLAANVFVPSLQNAFDAYNNPESWNKMLERATVGGEIDWSKVLNSAEMQNTISGLENQIDNFQTRISKAWQQLNPVVAAWANTDYTFNNLSKDMQSAAQAMIANFDFSEHGNKTEEQIQDYIKTNIINKINELAPTVQKKLTSLLSINANDYSLQDYKNKINSIVNEITASSNFTYEELMQRTGYSDVLKDYERTANNILEILDDSIPKYYENMASGTTQHFKALDRYGIEVQELKDKIYSMSPNEITKSFDIIAKYGIKTWDELADALANKTFDVVLNYDAEKEGREKLLAAIEESISATGLSAESIANLKNRYQDLESYDPARLFEETTNGIHLNVKALNELEREYEALNKTALDSKLEGLTDKYNELTNEIQNCADASERAVLYAQRDNILTQINDTATLAAQYAGLTSAYNKWQESQSGTDERNMYEGLISGKKELNDEMKRGWLDQSSIKYLELLSGKDLSTAKYDEILDVYKQLNQQIAGKYDVFDFFTADSSGNSTTAGIYNFFDTVLAKSKEIEEKIGRQVISKNADGGYVFDFGVDGDKAIADVLGISEELVQIILRAAQDAGFDINLDSAYSSLADFKDEVEVVNNRLKELGATTYTFNINSTNLDNVEKQIEEAKNAIKNLENEDGTIKVGVSEEDYQNAKTLLATLIYQKQTLDDAAILHIDTSNAVSGVEFVVQKLQEFKAAYNNYEVTAAVGADTSQAEADMQAAITELQGTSPTIRTALGIDLLKSNEEINTAINNITVDKLIEVGIDPTLVDEYMEAEHSTTGEVVWDNNIKKVTDWMAQKHETPGTVNWGNNIKNVRTHFTASGTINWSGKSVNVNGTANASGSAYAGGSWGAQKTETSLVGELGPEILVRDGKWTTVGDNGAEFTQVKKGDIIFNHKQTEELLKNGHVTGRGRAYSSGTAFSSGSGPGRYTITSAAINSGGGSAKDAAKDAAEEFREVFDWIAVRLEEINEDIDLRSAKLENAIGSTKQNAIVDDMIDLNEKLYDNLLAGADRYYSYAQTLLAKIPSAYREAAQNGTIAIEEFVGEVDEKTLEAIQEYRDWVQKGADATQQAEEVLTEISSLAKQAIDNISDDYGNKSSIRDSEIDQLDAYNKLTEAKYGAESANIYKEIIKETNNNIKTLQEQRNKMQAELNKQVQAGNIKKYSQDWYDAVNDIAAVDTKIIELTTDTYEYQDAINELHWDAFDNLMSRLEAISDEASSLIDILDAKDMVDEEGNWTDEGIATLGLYAHQMENAEVQSKKYREEIDYLNKNWESLGFTEQEYIEKLDELKSGQYDSIKAYQDAKDAIKDLTSERVDAIKNGIDKEIEAYEELIEKKKEALNAEKEAYDFQRSIEESTKEISDIERKIAALSADNSATARSKRAQLEAELLKVQQELQDKYYDKSIQDQQDALDKELESFQKEKDEELEGWDKYLENTETVVADGLAVVQSNTELVYQTLQNMGQEYSLLMSDALTSPWKDGESAIQSYAEKFGLSMSSTVQELQELANECEKIMSDTENYGNEVVNKVNGNITNYQDASQQPPASSTTTETAKTVKVGGKINAGNAKIYDFAGDTSGEKQYYSNDPIYKVLAIDGDWVQVRHHKQSTGVTGWFRKSQIQAYAKGTKKLDKSGLVNVDELGEELILSAKNGRLTYLEKGSGVIPADLTSNLMEWGKLDPSIMLDQNRPVISAPHVTNNETVINIEYGDILHIDNFSGDKPADLSKMIDKAFEKHMKQLNAEIRKFTR